MHYNSAAQLECMSHAHSATAGNAQSVEAFVVFREMLEIHMSFLDILTIAARKMLSLISALMLNDIRFMQWSFNSLN
jgi:hypothetical protein